jgi:hypothetical protein
LPENFEAIDSLISERSAPESKQNENDSPRWLNRIQQFGIFGIVPCLRRARQVSGYIPFSYRESVKITTY